MFGSKVGKLFENWPRRSLSTSISLSPLRDDGSPASLVPQGVGQRAQPETEMGRSRLANCRNAQSRQQPYSSSVAGTMSSTRPGPPRRESRSIWLPGTETTWCSPTSPPARESTRAFPKRIPPAPASAWRSRPQDGSRNAPTTSETSSSGVFATIKLDTSVHFYATTDKCPPPFLANWRTRAVRQPPRQERLSSYYGPRARYLLRMTRKVKRSRRRMILSIRLPPAL